MSHLRTCKIGLKNPNVSLLKMAFNDLANQFNGTIVNRVSGVSSSREVLLGLKARNFHRGYGITIGADGTVKLHGDEWGHTVKMEKFEKFLTQTYTKLALIQTLQARGYSVSQNTGESGLILVGDRL